MHHCLQHNPTYGHATISFVANWFGPGLVKEVNLNVPGEDMMSEDQSLAFRWLFPHVGINQDSAVEDQGCLTGQCNRGIWFIGGEQGYVVKRIEELEFMQTKNLVRMFVKAGLERVLIDARMVFPSHIIRMRDPTRDPTRQHADQLYMWMRRAPGKTLLDLRLTNERKDDPRLDKYRRAVLEPFERDNDITHQDFKGDNVLFDAKSGKYTMIDGFFSFRYCLKLLPDKPGVDYKAVKNDEELQALAKDIAAEENNLKELYDLGMGRRMRLFD